MTWAHKLGARTTSKKPQKVAGKTAQSASKAPRRSKPRALSRGITSINPATGQVLQTFEPHSKHEIEKRLQRSMEAFEQQRRSTLEQRAQAMDRAAEILEAERNDFAIIMTREMGKPVRAAVEEAKKCALVCRYYAGNASRFLAEEDAPAQTARSSIRFEPLGPVLAVMPWNFPFWQVFRFAAPALMAGNVGLLKHASNVPQCALAIEDIFRRAGFPEGAFQTLLVGSEQVGGLIEDARVRAVTLTGSLGAGRSVASAAGKMIKKSVLELGGSDPFIVMPSADLDAAVGTAVRARTINNGQSCIAAKRFIIDRQIAPEFEREFVKRMASLNVGDPMDETTDIGPLATAGVLRDLEAQVKKTVRMGARVLLGGRRVTGPGYFFPPTVLTDIPPGSPAQSEELFGPVASLWHADGMEEAVRIANDTPFGLGACAWTNDEHERDLFIEQIVAGVAVINGMVASTPTLPFGGVKQSGYGRELSSFGIREFVNIKAVSVYDTKR
jgi:succinate-semialdehyde dehydrogenase / glutarate-semialdehyde dehydrogenase